MSGTNEHFKQEQPRALYVHCLAHNLNLCVGCFKDKKTSTKYSEFYTKFSFGSKVFSKMITSI